MTDSTGPQLKYDAARGRITDGAIRYLLIRADGLMQLFAMLPEPLREAALAAFGASVRSHGGDSLRHYQSKQALDPAALLTLVSRASCHLGWGSWSFEVADRTRLSLSVRDSPFAAGYGTAKEPVCVPIVGMLTAVADIVLGCPTSVIETQCCAAGAPVCSFTAIACEKTGGETPS
jgi:predicted hydrocarbon binding protein